MWLPSDVYVAALLCPMCRPACQCSVCTSHPQGEQDLLLCSMAANHSQPNLLLSKVLCTATPDASANHMLCSDFAAFGCKHQASCKNSRIAPVCSADTLLLCWLQGLCYGAVNVFSDRCWLSIWCVDLNCCRLCMHSCCHHTLTACHHCSRYSSRDSIVEHHNHPNNTHEAVRPPLLCTQHCFVPCVHPKADFFFSATNFP
jgi:hypothetical protein